MTASLRVIIISVSDFFLTRIEARPWPWLTGSRLIGSSEIATSERNCRTKTRLVGHSSYSSLIFSTRVFLRPVPRPCWLQIYSQSVCSTNWFTTRTTCYLTTIWFLIYVIHQCISSKWLTIAEVVYRLAWSAHDFRFDTQEEKQFQREPWITHSWELPLIWREFLTSQSRAYILLQT